MKRNVSCIIILSLLFQIGCSSITQIPYPTDNRKSENEIRQLNYFGKRLSSIIHLNNSIQIEAYSFFHLQQIWQALLLEHRDDVA